MDGVFVTGTDTGVGKTTVSAGLLSLLHGSHPTAYWKPIQTGTIIGDDTEEVRSLTEFAPETYISPGYRFPDPLAPTIAARKWKKVIEIDALMGQWKRERNNRLVIVEGAGGILVPLTEDELQVDFVARLKIPLLIVASDRLGTINHTLLTVNAARAAGVEVLGVILTRTEEGLTKGNAECIERFGKVEVLASLKSAPDGRSAVAQVGGNPRLRELFKVSALPL